MNSLLRNIADNASADLQKLIEEGAEDILKAIHKTEEEAQANDAKPKFSLGFKITVDFDAASYNCDLSWTLKQSLGTTHSIDDPNQPKLPMDDGLKSTDDEELIQQCIEVIRSEQKASISLLQRRLRLGYTFAARIMDELERRGIVGPAKGAEPREIIATN